MMAKPMAAAGVLLLAALALLSPGTHAQPTIGQTLHADGGKMCYRVTFSAALEDKCRTGFFWITDPGSNALGKGWCCPCLEGTYSDESTIRSPCLECPLGYTTNGGAKSKSSDCVASQHLVPGNRFGLRTSHNTYVGLRSVTPTGPSQLQAVYSWIGEWETFTAVASPLTAVTNRDNYVNTQLAFNITHLRSPYNGLVTNAFATANTPVVTNHAALVDAYEHMIVEPRTRDGGVSIRARSLQHVWQASNGGGGDIVLRNVPIGSWERFNVVLHGGLRAGQVVALKTYNGRYVSTTPPQGLTVQGVTSGPTSIGLWERWAVMLPPGSNGNIIALRSLSYGLTYDNKYRMMIGLSNGDLRIIWATPGDNRTRWEIKPRTSDSGAVWVSLRNVGINGGHNYMRAVDGGGGIVDINSQAESYWERFQIVPVY